MSALHLIRVECRPARGRLTISGEPARPGSLVTRPGPHLPGAGAWQDRPRPTLHPCPLAAGQRGPPTRRSPPNAGQLALEHTGDLYSCDHYVEPGYLLGNINDTHMLELIMLPQQRTFGRAKRDTLTRYCRECDIRFACHGGCPKDRFATSPYGEPGQHYLCPGYKDFFHHAGKPMETMAGLLRANRAPSELMRIYAKQTRSGAGTTSAPAATAASGSTATAPDRPDRQNGIGMAGQVVARPLPLAAALLVLRSRQTVTV